MDLFLQGLFLMLSEGFYCIHRAHECEFGSLGLGAVAGRAPSLRTKREGGQEFPWLFVRPSCILFVQKEGLFAEPPRVRA